MSDPVADIAVKEEAQRELPQKLFDAGCYHQARLAAEAAWGPLPGWLTHGDALLGSRILSQLGLYRSSAALILWSWRRSRVRHFSLHYAYVLTRLNMNGPAVARDAWRSVDMQDAAPEDQAWWQALGCIIHGCFRDWELAQSCLDAAIAHGLPAAHLVIEQAWLLEQQDRYDEALALLQGMYPPDGNQERNGIQARARLLEVTGQREQAMALLKSALERFESVELGMRLHFMQRNDGLLDEAEQTLKCVRNWLPVQATGLSHDIALAEAEVLYRRGQMDATLEALVGARGYFYRKVRESLAENRHTGLCRQLDVPFIRQHHMTCAPATLTALWRFHGHDIDHLTLAESICYDGTADLAERRWVESQGWALREFELNLDDVRTLIDAGCPVGLTTVEPGSAHMQAIIGYDTRKGIYLLRDPYYPAIQEMLIEGAHEAYAASGPRCLVAVPPERRAWLEALPLRHAALYEDYDRLQQSLSINDRTAAVHAADALQQRAPGHRLALWARRSLASYDNDSLGVLEQTDALLQLFPQDLNLLGTKSRLLSDLGRESERLVFLEETCRGGQRHPFLLQALAESLSLDGRRLKELRQVLRDILKRQPLNANAWWTLAGSLWDAGEREEAFSCYRICICLEDKVESYALSYFKAARYLRRSEEALAYLMRRVELLGKRSAHPYISYARALDILDRSAEAMVLLDQALERHDDAWLIAESFDFFCNSGKPEKAEALLEQRGHLLSEVTLCHKRIRLMQYHGDRKGELAMFRRILELQPRNEHAAASVAGLLADSESPEQAIAFLDEKLLEKPENVWLLREKLSYVQRLPLSVRTREITRLFERRPDDARLAVAQARLWRGEAKYEQARTLIETAISREPGESWLQLEAGDIAMEMGLPDAARQSYENAIRLFIDTNGVFERLVSTYPGVEGKRDALGFIHAELMRQVSMGNGILEFQALARRYLPDAEVRAFLDQAVSLRPDLWQSWGALANFLHQINRPDEAIPVLEEGMRRFPLLPRLHLDRGELARQEGDFSAAEMHIRTAIAINPAYGLAITKLADVLELKSDLGAARDVIERGLNASPRYIAFYGYLADLQWRLGEREAALETVRRSLRVDMEYGWGWTRLKEWSEVLGHHDEAEQLVEKFVFEFPDSASLWKHAAAIVKSTARKHECLQKAFELEPHVNEAIFSRCDLLVQEGALHEAKALLDRTYQGREKTSEVLTYEAWLTEKTGRRDEAIAQLEAVVDADPGHYNAWRLLARWYDEGARSEDCCRCLRKCVNLYPLSASVLGMAADMLLRHLTPEYEFARRTEAREYLERAIKQDHTNTYCFLTLADLYLDEGMLADCETLLGSNFVDGDHNFVRGRRLRLRLLQGDIEAALEHYRAILSSGEENDWLLTEPCKWFAEKNKKQQVWDLLQALAADVKTPTSVARAWMYCLLMDDAAAKPVAKALARIAGNFPFWRDAVLCALRGAATPAQLSVFFWEGHAVLKKNGALWSALVAYHTRHDGWAQIMDMSAPGKVLPDEVTARALYFSGVGWRMKRDWRHGESLMADARELARDDSHHNLLLWEQCDAGLRDRRRINTALLSGLSLGELSKLECLLIDVLQAFHDWEQGGDLVAMMQAVWPRYHEHCRGALYECTRRQVFWAIWRQWRGNRLLAFWQAWRCM